MCSKGNFSLEKGFTKNRIELAESLQKLGWETLLVDKKKLGLPLDEKYNAEKYGLALKNFLIKNNDAFDVVLYEYDTLPFDRNLFNKKTLFVARPAILAFHFPLIKFKYNLKTKLSNLYQKLKSFLKQKHEGSPEYYGQLEYGLSQADLIQVQNKKDKDLLIERGFSSQHIIIVPNGITPERIEKFASISRSYEEPFTVAFVGTFDFRKGAMDFPVFFKKLKEKFPTIRLKLLGTRGMFYSEDQVLEFFPKKYRRYIEVVPMFKADDLPQLLSDCHIGVFPSYLESFGFGALEMMCAGLPVVAYDAPGPCDFILSDLLTPIGDPVALGEKVISLLENKQLLEQKGRLSREVVLKNYCWDDIAKNVDRHYKQFLKELS